VTLRLSADQVEPFSRDLHIYVKPAGVVAYYIAVAVAVLIAAVALAYRKFGRR